MWRRCNCSALCEYKDCTKYQNTAWVNTKWPYCYGLQWPNDFTTSKCYTIYNIYQLKASNIKSHILQHRAVLVRNKGLNFIKATSFSVWNVTLDNSDHAQTYLDSPVSWRPTMMTHNTRATPRQQTKNILVTTKRRPGNHPKPPCIMSGSIVPRAHESCYRWWIVSGSLSSLQEEGKQVIEMSAMISVWSDCSVGVLWVSSAWCHSLISQQMHIIISFHRLLFSHSTPQCHQLPPAWQTCTSQPCV